MTSMTDLPKKLVQSKMALIRMRYNVYITKVIDGERIIVDILRKDKELHAFIDEDSGAIMNTNYGPLDPNSVEIFRKD